MKTILAITSLLFSFSTYATPIKVKCLADQKKEAAIQNTISVDAELNFELERNGNKSVLTNIVGHVFITDGNSEQPKFDTENSYMGFFKTEKLVAKADYNPRKYKGYAQFENFNAVHSTGIEEGMFGYLALDVSSNKNDFKAVYVFQAGDHMGGTAFLSCKAH